MALTETIKFYVGIQDDGLIEFRKTRVIMDGAEVVGEKHFREVLEPGQNVSTYPGKIKSICNLIWTPQVVSDYALAKAARLAAQATVP